MQCKIKVCIDLSKSSLNIYTKDIVIVNIGVPGTHAILSFNMLTSEIKLRTKNSTLKQGFEVHTSECYLETDEIAKHIIGSFVLSPLSNLDIHRMNRIRLTKLHLKFK